MYKTALAVWIVMAGWVAQAEIISKPVEYRQGDTVLEGWSVYDDAIAGKRPGVLVVHQWKGAGDYEKKRAEMLARLGYGVFVADIYGKGVRPQTPQAAGAEAGKYKADRALPPRSGAGRLGGAQGIGVYGPSARRRHRLLFRRHHGARVGAERGRSRRSGEFPRRPG